MLNLSASTATAQSSAESRSSADSPMRPVYELLRDEEDWSFLADRSRSADAWDPVKFVPFQWIRGSYMSLGGEMRQQYERFANEEWGSEPPDRSGHLLQRYMFHADVRLGPRVRLFGQLKSGIETGRAGGPRRADEDRLDIHQGYAEVNVGSTSKVRSVSFRVGRQEFNFGSSRLVSVREGPNVRQSFDAVRSIVHYDAWRFDAFVSRPVVTTPAAFDDGRDEGRALWGLYAVQRSASRNAGLDMYYLGHERNVGRFDQGSARERRHSVGTRIWGRINATDYNAEVIAQWGTFGTSVIRAWTVASDTGYHIRLRGNPRIGMHADITSGDRDRNDEVLGTFHPLFPRGAYFGLIAPTGPLNHIDLHPSISFAPHRDVVVSATWLFFWRTQRDDGLYGVPGNLLRSGEGIRARFVGQSPGIEAKWQANRHLSFTSDLALFSAGPFLEESPPARTIFYFAAWSTYKF